MPTDSPESFQQIADVLSQSLKKAFKEVCPERYGGPLSLQRLDTSDDAKTVSFRLRGESSIALDFRVTLSHVGGNVYDIATQVEDGPVQEFTYSEPDASGSPLSLAPYLGTKIARHLLDEIEQHLGKTLLQKQMASEM